MKLLTPVYRQPEKKKRQIKAEDYNVSTMLKTKTGNKLLHKQEEKNGEDKKFS